MQVGGLLGVKTVLNEFIAYQQLGELMRAGALSPRSAVIASYALCGFANFGSLAILLGGLGGLAPVAARRGGAPRACARSSSGSLASLHDGVRGGSAALAPALGSASSRARAQWSWRSARRRASAAARARRGADSSSGASSRKRSRSAAAAPKHSSFS